MLKTFVRMLRTLRTGVAGLLVLIICASAGERSAFASDALTSFNPDMNGVVNAIANGNGVTYLGGSFTSVNSNLGSMARLDINTGLADTNFPQVTNGLVDHILPDGSGGWYISGEFTTVAGVTRNRIAHILANETLDPNFNPNADNRVYNLKLVGTTLYCAGMFANIGGQARSKLAALDTTTGLATAWNPGAINGTIVWGLDINANSVYIGGDFTSAGGQTRNYIAAIDSTSGNATSWNPNSTGTIYWLLYNNGLVYVGGTYSTIGGQNRNNLAAIDASGDSTNGQANIWNPNCNGPVWHIIISSSNLLYAAGNFTQVNGGTARPDIACFDVSNLNTGTCTSFNCNANGIVWWSVPVGNTLYVGGQFTAVGGQTRDYMGAVDQTTGLATSWVSNASAQVYTLTYDGTSILAGGPFTALVLNRGNLVAVNSTNGIVEAWNPTVVGTVDALALSGTTLYVGGQVTSIAGKAVTGLGAVDTGTGVASTTFVPTFSANPTISALLLNGSNVYAGGTFTTAGGSARVGAAAFTTAGALAAWNPNPSAGASVKALTLNGSDVLLGGTFTTLGGSACVRLGEVDLVNGTSQGFNGNCNNTVDAIYTNGSRIYAGGTFTTAGPGNTARNFAAAWDLPGLGLDTTWNPTITGTNVLAINGYLSDLFLAGTFTKVQGTARVDLASVDPVSSSLAAGYNPTANGAVNALLVNSASPLFTLYAGGAFTTMGGSTRDYAASFDLNQSPTAISISSSTVINNSSNGTIVATFSTTDPNPNDIFTYNLTSSAGGLFGISGNQLVVANTAVFTNPPPASYSITVQSTDAGGQSVTQGFTLTVTVVKQTPVVTWAAPANIVYGTALSATQLNATANVPGTFVYSPAAGTVLAAGAGQSLVVTFNPTDTTDYSSANGSTAITVSKAPLTVTANNASRVYNTPNPAFTATDTGFVNGDTSANLGGTLTFATTATLGSPKGTYPITPSGLTSTNYAITYVNGTLTIATAAPVITWTAPANIAYGTALGATQLNATANVPGTFAYSPLAGTVLHVGVGESLSVVFTPTDTVNYTTANANQSITVTAVPLTITANNASRAYNTANPAFTVAYSGFVNGDTAASLTGTLSEITTATIASVVGSYPITASGLSDKDYTVSYVGGTLTITQATPVITWAGPANIVYGTALSATQLNATANVAGSFVYSPPSSTVLAAGAGQTLNCTFTPTDSTDYTTATGSTTITVTKAVLTVNATAMSKAYGAAMPVLTYSVSGYVNGDTSAVVSGTANLSSTATAASAVGSYTDTVTSVAGLSAANYSFAIGATAGFTITPVALTITAGNAAMSYGGAVPIVSFSSTGLVNSDVIASVTESTSVTSASPVGSYAVTPSAPVFTQGRRWRLPHHLCGWQHHRYGKAVLTVNASAMSKAYGAAMPALTYSYAGLQNSDTSAVVTGTPVLTSTATATSAAGSYTDTVTSVAGLSATNYSFAIGATAVFSVTPVALTITAGNGVMTYGGLVPTVTFSTTGLVNSDVIASVTETTSVTSASPVGSYAVTPSAPVFTHGAAGDYTITYVAGNITVGQAVLTVNASAMTKAYGAAMPVLTYSFTGFQNSDGNGVVTGSPTLTSTATATSAVGSYIDTVTSVAGLSATNYSFAIGATAVFSVDPGGPDHHRRQWRDDLRRPGADRDLQHHRPGQQRCDRQRDRDHQRHRHQPGGQLRSDPERPGLHPWCGWRLHHHLRGREHHRRPGRPDRQRLGHDQGLRRGHAGPDLQLCRVPEHGHQRGGLGYARPDQHSHRDECGRQLHRQRDQRGRPLSHQLQLRHRRHGDLQRDPGGPDHHRRQWRDDLRRRGADRDLQQHGPGQQRCDRQRDGDHQHHRHQPGGQLCGDPERAGLHPRRCSGLHHHLRGREHHRRPGRADGERQRDDQGLRRGHAGPDLQLCRLPEHWTPARWSRVRPS